MLMARQAAIFRLAPRFRCAYFPGRDRSQPKIIPDTPKARKRALDDGATHFDTLSFTRADFEWAPPRRLFGDCVCKIFADTPVDPANLVALENELRGILLWPFEVSDQSNCVVHRVNDHRLLLAIPAWVLGVGDGSCLLYDYYSAFAEVLRQMLRRRGFKNFVVDAGGTVPTAVFPFLFAVDGSPPPGMMRQVEDAENVKTAPRIAFSLERECWAEAVRRRKERNAIKASSPSPWVPLRPLIDANGIPACSGATVNGLKCAIKLQAWIQQLGITEFRCRDALRAVDGMFTLDSGVDEALGILCRHGFIRECEPLFYSQPGRRPGPWLIVNPAVFGGCGRN